MDTVMKKTIGVNVPCYNEKENIVQMAEALIELFETQLPQYDYVIQFIDNCSTDGTVALLRGLCEKHKKVRAILNARNFPATSGYWGIINCSGDCVITIPCDFQVPLNLIPKMIEKWENGAKIVCLIKNNSKENRLMLAFRRLYYRLSNQFSDIEIIRGFTGSGLYDQSFLNTCRAIRDPIVPFGQMVVTMGYNIERLYYTEERRKAGRSKSDLGTLVNTAISRFTDSSSTAPRYAIIIGFIIGLLSFLVAVVFFILKLLYWDQYPAGMIPVLLGVFLLGSLQLFFIGMIGEYVIKANIRLMNHPLVVERERINFPPEDVDGANRTRGK